MERLCLTPSAPDPVVLARAAAVLCAGGVVIYPTDTLYGLAVDPRDAAAVLRVVALKGRPAGMPLPLIAASVAQVEVVAVLSPLGRRLADHFWPGPLTLVAEARPGLRAEVSEAGGVAIRVPDHEVARGLAAAAGFAITSTSANASGGEAPESADQAVAGLPEGVDVVLDSGPTRGGPPSTIVDVRASIPRLIREGAVAFDRVLAAVLPR